MSKIQIINCCGECGYCIRKRPQKDKPASIQCFHPAVQKTLEVDPKVISPECPLPDTSPEPPTKGYILAEAPDPGTCVGCDFFQANDICPGATKMGCDPSTIFIKETM